MRFRTSAAALLALVALAHVAHAQREKEPKRPKLDAHADTNDAHAYYAFAMDQLAGDPDKSADALYWATRLEPTWADAFYARRVALLLTDPHRLSRYWLGDKGTIQSNDVKRIDSLFYQALTLNPFVPQVLDRKLFEGVADEISRRYERAGAGSATEIRYAIDAEIKSWPSADRAWLAYGDGRYGDALDLYAQAIREDKRNGPLRVDRARVFYNMNKPDSALAELTLAIEDLRKRDKKDLIYVYQSKALTEHSIAVIEQRLGHTDAAREALGRALQEDLSYYPAHLQLAFMALESKDTTTALSEMDLAMQLRGDDAATRYLYGYTLAAAGKATESEVQLRKALELNSVYAPPHFTLGLVLENLKRPAEALAEYRVFLARASRSDGRRDDAQARIAAIGAGDDRGSRR